MDRAEHIRWCKRRALEYYNKGDLTNAVASMASDLNKHPETADKQAFGFLIIMAAMQASAGDSRAVYDFITGFAE